MSSLRVLTVCTGNTCRSPMAEALVRARLVERGIAAEVASVGTLGWSERPATAKAVEVMADMGLDISAHRSRRMETADLDVDLILAMTRVHADAVIARDKTMRASVFLPTELNRLLRTTEGWEPVRGVERSRDLKSSLAALGSARSEATIGRPNEEVADPAGESLDVYRATAERLDAAITGFVARLVP